MRFFVGKGGGADRQEMLAKKVLKVKNCVIFTLQQLSTINTATVHYFFALRWSFDPSEYTKIDIL